MKRSRLPILRRGLLGICCALILPLALVACGQTQGGPQGGTGSSSQSIPSKVVVLDANGFQTDSVKITATNGLDFVNMPSSPERDICLGQAGKCDAHASGPGALKGGGILLRNDESQTVAFNKPGTYHITSTPTPVHDLTVTVT